jgi:hypothetical protein
MESKRKWIFIAYAVLVLLIPTYIIGSSENILNNGKLYKFRVRGKDPIDIFRGNFIRVRIDTQRIPTDKSDWKAGEKVYLTIDTDDEGYAYFKEALRNPPKKGDYMESRVVRWWGFEEIASQVLFGRTYTRRRTTVDTEMPNNLSKYFINEEFALDGEFAIDRMRGASAIHVRMLNGDVRLDDIYIGPTRLMKYLESGGPIPEVGEGEIFFNF